LFKYLVYTKNKMSVLDIKKGWQMELKFNVYRDLIMFVFYYKIEVLREKVTMFALGMAKE